MTMFGFLGGTIMAVETGYKVLPHPKPDKIYNRLSDAKWFLAQGNTLGRVLKP